MGAKILSEVYINMAVVFFFSMAMPLTIERRIFFCPKSDTTFGYLLAEPLICTYHFPLVFWNNLLSELKSLSMVPFCFC